MSLPSAYTPSLVILFFLILAFIIFIAIYLFTYLIHLLTYAYIVWVISPPCPSPPPFSPTPPSFQAEPVLPLSLILLKRRHKHNKEDRAFLLAELRIAIQKNS
jgi:hypothetical protein